MDQDNGVKKIPIKLHLIYVFCGLLLVILNLILILLPMLWVSLIFYLADGGVSSLAIISTVGFPNIFSIPGPFSIFVFCVIISFILKKIFRYIKLSRGQIFILSATGAASIILSELIYSTSLLLFVFGTPSAVFSALASIPVLTKFSIFCYAILKIIVAAVGFALPWILIKNKEKQVNAKIKYLLVSKKK